MSQIQVTSLETTDNLAANNITAGAVTINSAGLHVSSTLTINSSSIKVSSGGTDQFLSPTISTANITIGGTSYTQLYSETVNSQIFTANGTWTKPSWATTGNELVIVHMWGGGAIGSLAANGGGGGGAFVFGYFKSSHCDSTCSVVVGRNGTIGSPKGNNSIFSVNATSSLVAYGGGPASVDAGLNQAFGGSGGGWLSEPSANSSGTFPSSPLSRGANSSVNAIDSTFGGGGGGWGNAAGSSRSSTSSIYGGGGGTGANSSSVVEFSSIFGGAGGRSAGPVLRSIYGGNGGNASMSATTPGGGGGTSGSGARGEVRVYTLRYVGP